MIELLTNYNPLNVKILQKLGIFTLNIQNYTKIYNVIEKLIIDFNHGGQESITT